jgi:hypothetical protein
MRNRTKESPSVGPAIYLGHDPRASEKARRAARARATGRRRGIDPATNDRDYSDAELEFMLAIEEYKRLSGRKFPTWSEALEVLQSLGYARVAAHAAAA